ncbi:MAG TPA: hypothetical protein VFS76_11370 [Pyrinomonadaceae bacterium]|nr:hypothetical protein [Pyrinomonadaceae bacterium]
MAVLLYFIRSGSSDQARSVSTIVNESFSATFDKPASFKVTVPSDAKNARVVGGFKVTSGTAVNFFIVSDSQFQQWSAGVPKESLFQRQQTPTAKVRQLLGPGTYYILFSSPDSNKPVTVAAELYSKYD